MSSIITLPATDYLIHRLLKMIASRVRDAVDPFSNTQGRSPPSELGRNNTNLKTVAVLPVSRNVPATEFARKLQAALEGIGASTAFLNKASISSNLGRHAFTRMGKLKACCIMVGYFCYDNGFSPVCRLVGRPGAKV